jgi:hypothetical protein
MPGQDIFADDWRECLRAHYKYIIGSNDKVTEKSLNEVMAKAGFTEAELYEMRLEVTMHVDNSGADYVPDAAVVEYFASAEVPADAEALPVSVAEAVVDATAEFVAVESPPVDEVAELEMDESEISEDEADEPPPPEEPPPDLKQLSLF